MSKSTSILSQFDGPDNPYVPDYIRRCLENDTIESPDTAQAGNFLSLLETLYQEFMLGGKEAVHAAWNRIRQLGLSTQINFAAYERKIYHASDLKNLQKPIYLFESLIPEQSLVVLYGSSGSGKTFICLDYAVKISQKYQVIYLAAEGKSGYSARISAIETHLGIDTSGLQLDFVFNSVDFCNSEKVREFVELIRPKQPKVLVIDTLARNMVGDENSSRDMGEFIHSCDHIIAQLGLTIILIHHTGKKGSDARGSSALRGAADVMIGLRNNDGVIEIYCDKSKDAPEFPKRYFKLLPVQIDEETSSCVVVPSERTQQADETQLTNTQREVLEILAYPIFVESGARNQNLKDTVSIALSTLYNVLSKLKTAGLIRQSKKGDPYYITEEGLQALQPHRDED